jgi:hypothetical protein
MLVPKQKSVQLAKNIAKEIVKIKIESETFFNFDADADYKNSNSVDRNFLQNLKDKADLSVEYIDSYSHG